MTSKLTVSSRKSKMNVTFTGRFTRRSFRAISSCRVLKMFQSIEKAPLRKNWKTKEKLNWPIIAFYAESN